MNNNRTNDVANLLDDPCFAVTAATQMNKNKQDDTVTVIIAGSRFSVVPSLWMKVQSLPWLMDVHGYPQLVHANPDTFELLLQYFLFGSLPSGLSKHDATELMELSSPLAGVKTLVNHLEATIDAMDEAESNKARKKNSSSFLAKHLTPKKVLRKKLSDRKLKYIPDTVYPFAANKDNATLNVDYLPNLEATDSTDSDETTLTGNSSSYNSSASGDNSSCSVVLFANMESNKNKRTLLLSSKKRGGTASSIFNSMKFSLGGGGGGKRSRKNNNNDNSSISNTKRKLTHEEWCASDYVL